MSWWQFQWMAEIWAWKKSNSFPRILNWTPGQLFYPLHQASVWAEALQTQQEDFRSPVKSISSSLRASVEMSKGNRRPEEALCRIQIKRIQRVPWTDFWPLFNSSVAAFLDKSHFCRSGKNTFAVINANLLTRTFWVKRGDTKALSIFECLHSFRNLFWGRSLFAQLHHPGSSLGGRWKLVKFGEIVVLII